MIETKRLHLFPLPQSQLDKLLVQPSQVEREFGIRLCKDITAGRVEKAINMKLDKMKAAPVSTHDWITYWLLVIKAIPLGAGLLGFKGYPDENGAAEIGYGIDAAYRSQGYITEAFRSMINWAFREKDCLCIIAPQTLKSNPASNRVLEKVGMQINNETLETLSWKLDRASYKQE